MSELSEDGKLSCCFKAHRPQLFDLTDGCQFPNETSLYEVDGQHFCQFHLPLKDQSGQLTVKKTWDRAEKKSFANGITNLLNNAIVDPNQDGVADLTGVQFFQRYDFRAWARQNALYDELIFEPDKIPDEGYPFPRICAHKTIFAPITDFRNLAISFDSDFSESVFGIKTQFNGAKFESEVDFSNAKFNGSVHFSDVHFAGGVSFNKACFYQKAYFDRTVFKTWSWFMGSEFFDDAMFQNAKFIYFGNFETAVFKKGVDFSTSDNQVIFAQMSFKGTEFATRWPDDWGAELQGRNSPRVRFTNRKFTDAADFRGAKFYVAPDFHDAQLHQGCSIGEADFLDVEQQDAPAFYRTLKLAMEQKRDWTAMAKFYALEQKSQRHQPGTPWAIKAMSWAYEVLSDYGQNSVRPLIGLLVTAFVAFELYGLTYGSLVGGGEAQALVDILHFDVMQMVKPFDAIVSGVPFDDLGGFGRLIFGTIATLQTLFTIGLLTLFVLAVRRRFRMA